MLSLIDRFGLEGYGAFWVMVEVIAENMTQCGLPELSLPEKSWRKFIQFSPKKFHLFLDFLREKEIFEVKNETGNVWVKYNKLFELNDEYNKRGKSEGKKMSGQNSESSRVSFSSSAKRKEYKNISTTTDTGDDNPFTCYVPPPDIGKEEGINLDEERQLAGWDSELSKPSYRLKSQHKDIPPF